MPSTWLTMMHQVLVALCPFWPPPKKSRKKTQKKIGNILKTLKPPAPAPPAAISVILRSALRSPLKMWMFQLLWQSLSDRTNGLKLQFSGNIPKKTHKMILLMAEIWRSPVDMVVGLIDPRWCRISSINIII